tara:strand:+ start:15869 stop:16465 length:597 start_codon:yes stop_codon:yes gene_type:complete
MSNKDLTWSDCDVALAGFSNNSGFEDSKKSKWKYHMYKFVYYCGNINAGFSLISLLFSSYSLVYLKKYILVTMPSFYCLGYFLYSAKFCYNSLISESFNELIVCCKESNKDFKDEKELFNKFLGNINFKTNLMGLFGIIWILSISNLKHGIFGLLSVYVGYNMSYCFFPKKLLEKYTKIEINSQNNLCSMEMGNIHTE